jgi:hypothetical protein
MCAPDLHWNSRTVTPPPPPPHTHTQGNAVEIQIPAQLNFMGCSMTALLPVLLLSNIILPSLSHCAFISARNNKVHISKTFFSVFITFLGCKSEDVLVREFLYFVTKIYWKSVELYKVGL